MVRRVVLTAWALSLAAVPFVACGGDNVTIPADEPDSAAPDVTTAADTSAGQDTSTSGDDTSTGADTAKPDGTPTKDSGGSDAPPDGGPADAPDDVQPPPYDGGPLNGCSNNYVDRTNGGQNNRAITVQNAAVNPTYDVPCMLIQKGQKVEWDMVFNVFPLAPFGGDQPNPIQPVNMGTTTQVSFPNTGTYGFHSPGHANMVGAIKVVN
jgi:hypothetical protein